MNAVAILLGYVTVLRLFGLLLARRNTKRLLVRGGEEQGRNHYPVIVSLHLVWLVGLWWFATTSSINSYWLAMFVVLQLLRFWVIWTLGDLWTTRIIVVPGESKVVAGPYHYLNHPNYVVVIGEIAVLPLALGMINFALLFSVLNAMVLSIRIKAENKALKETEFSLKN